MPLAAAAQIGMTKRFPNVWIGTGSQVAPTARLNAPCWIGRNVLIGDNAVIGPNTIIEDQCFVDEKAVIEESHVAQRTYIGTNTDVVKSFAWGPKLLNWQNGSGLVIQDRFLLARLGAGEDRSNQFQPGLGERILAVLTMILTLGDCYQCLDPSNDDARAHATFFAVHADTATKRKILSWLLFGS